MPYRVLLSSADPFAVVELLGAVRWADVAAALRGLYLHPVFERGAPVLWDWGRITSLDIAPGDLPDVLRAFEEVAVARDGGRTAFLTGPGNSEAEVWALFPRLGPPSTRRVAVFHRRADALGFLGREAMPEEMAEVAAS